MFLLLGHGPVRILPRNDERAKQRKTRRGKCGPVLMVGPDFELSPFRVFVIGFARPAQARSTKTEKGTSLILANSGAG